MMVSWESQRHLGLLPWAGSMGSSDRWRLAQSRCSSSWFLRLSNQLVLMEEDSPERRSMHLALPDGEGGIMVMGGKTDCGIVDDVWKLHLQNLSWESYQEPTVGVSCERYGIEGCDAFCF